MNITDTAGLLARLRAHYGGLQSADETTVSEWHRFVGPHSVATCRTVLDHYAGRHAAGSAPYPPSPAEFAASCDRLAAGDVPEHLALRGWTAEQVAAMRHRLELAGGYDDSIAPERYDGLRRLLTGPHDVAGVVTFETGEPPAPKPNRYALNAPAAASLHRALEGTFRRVPRGEPVTPAQAATVLEAATGSIDRLEAERWHGELGDLQFEEVLEAVHVHGQRTPADPDPTALRLIVGQQRAARAADEDPRVALGVDSAGRPTFAMPPWFWPTVEEHKRRTAARHALDREAGRPVTFGEADVRPGDRMPAGSRTAPR